MSTQTQNIEFIQFISCDMAIGWKITKAKRAQASQRAIKSIRSNVEGHSRLTVTNFWLMFYVFHCAHILKQIQTQTHALHNVIECLIKQKYFR